MNIIHSEQHGRVFVCEFMQANGLSRILRSLKAAHRETEGTLIDVKDLFEGFSLLDCQRSSSLLSVLSHLVQFNAGQRAADLTRRGPVPLQAWWLCLHIS